MFLQNLSTKLAESLDALGRLLDLIHRFPHNQRKQYFEKIQTFKNQLLSLKSNLRQPNALQTQRKYNTIHLAVTSLATQIDEEINLVANKENRHPNQAGFIRQSKKSQQEALRLLAEKDEEISQLKQLVFEKEELIRLNYEELRDYQRDCNLLAHENHAMSSDISRLVVEIKDLNQHLDAVETQLTELRLLTEEQKRQLRIKDQGIQKTTDELITAKEKILNLQELAEVSMRKACIVEDNIRRVEEQAAFLNCNYKQREEQSIQRQKQIEKLKYQARARQKQFAQLQHQNRDLKKSIEALEQQVDQYQQNIYAYGKEQRQAQSDFEQDLSRWKELSHDLQQRYNQKITELEQCQTKFIDLYNQLERRSDEIDALRTQRQVLIDNQQNQQQIIAKLSAEKTKVQKQNSLLNHQKTILSEQIQKSIQTNQQYEQNLTNLREKARAQQLQIGTLQQTIKQLQQQNQIHQINCAQYQASQDKFRKLIQDYDQKILQMENKASAKVRIEAELRRRLLKAKIQVVHEIRSSLEQ